MERKKIVPKAKLNAAQQEELLQHLQQSTESTVNLQQNTENKPEITKETIKSTAKAVKTSQNTVIESNTLSVQRVTVDMPAILYEQMKSEVDENGKTIKGFIVNLIKAHFAKK